MKYSREHYVNFIARDYNGRIKISEFMSMMQEIADYQAKQMKIDNASIIDNGYAWILNRVFVGIESNDKSLINLNVTTFPRLGSGLEFPRDYLIENLDGKPVAKATSFWSVIDVEQRKLIRTNEFYEYTKFCENEGVFANDIKKVRAQRNFSQDNFRYSYTVKLLDLDMLGHVNNTRYGDIIVNAMTKGELNRGIKFFNITFINELLLDETVSIFVKIEYNKLICQGQNENKIAFVCEIELFD